MLKSFRKFKINKTDRQTDRYILQVMLTFNISSIKKLLLLLLLLLLVNDNSHVTQNGLTCAKIHEMVLFGI